MRIDANDIETLLQALLQALLDAPLPRDKNKIKFLYTSSCYVLFFYQKK